jgi:hypothetical protein
MNNQMLMLKVQILDLDCNPAIQKVPLSIWSIWANPQLSFDIECHTPGRIQRSTNENRFPPVVFSRQGEQMTIDENKNLKLLRILFRDPFVWQ